MSKLKLAGTPLDRRSTSAWKRDEIIAAYNSGYSKKEIAELFNISNVQVWRYLNHNKYLEQCKRDSMNYANRKRNTISGKALFNEAHRISANIHNEYVRYLMECKEKFKPSITEY